MTMSIKRLLTLGLISAIPATSMALPIDWHGSFGVDASILNNFRRLESGVDRSSTNDGSQEVGLDAGEKKSASWQSYVLKLSPNIIINDAATFKGEITTGYASGGLLGDSAASSFKSANSIQVPYHSNASGTGLNIKKAFVELYADTATFQIGRHATHWGLGAIYNEGANVWDRHSSSRDGITMKLKIGNFHLAPFWSKVSTEGYTDSTNAKEMGVSLFYDNQEKDLSFGLLYAVRNANAENTIYDTTINNPAAQPVGQVEIKTTDIFVKKTWGKFDLALEIPLMSGDIGKLNGTDVSSYSAKAILVQTNYKPNDNWTFGFDGGQVSGHDGSSKFGALYLHPNFQVANLLYRYNVSAVGDKNNQSIYDSYVTNSLYLKLRAAYESEKWIFSTAIIRATALETAEAGKSAYNHSKNKIFTAATTQDDNLGTEIDFNAVYKWNNEIKVGAGLGYLMVGDYFGYTNDPAIVNEVKNSFILQANTSITF